MKKYKYLLALCISIGMAGCTDDDFADKGIPVEAGDEILFGAALTNTDSQDNASSRTIYGNRTATGIPVYWEPEGTDTIAIFCPQVSAPATRLVNYKVIPEVGGNQTSSAKVVKVDLNAAGLQWGTQEEHVFYGVYPHSIVKQTDTDDQNGIITAHLPVSQDPLSWRVDTRDPKFNRVYRGEPNMDYAIMFAHKHVKKSDIVAGQALGLDFQNLVTVVDMTIPGPETGSMTVTNVTLHGIEGQTALVGDFNIYAKEGSDEQQDNQPGECQPVKNDKVNSYVSISCFDKERKEFITLKQGEAINVKAYIIPDTDQPIEPRTLKVAVSSLNGAVKRKTLQKASIVPHKINRVLLPKLEAGEPGYWMSSLDPDIYLSELSIPGSKFSYNTEANGASPVYQTKTIEEQFKAGVRAFIVQTGAKCTYDKSGIIRPTYTFQKNSATMNVHGLNQKIDIKETFKAIADQLKFAHKSNKTNEFAVVMLTADFSGVSGDHVNFLEVEASRAWIESLKDYLPRLAADPELKDYIYTNEVTNNTTIADVAGKIIFKVNYNTESQQQWTAEGDKIPALFTMWTAPAADYKLLTENMYWGWTGTKSSTSAKLEWTYQEVTNIGASDSEATLDTKVTAIKTLFQKGVDAYGEDAEHKNWFMNDLGGKFTSESDIPTTVPNTVLGNNRLTEAVAYHINSIAVEELQKRGNNASTGLVFINFADRDTESGAKFKSDYILATIIDNNFKFALRKKPSDTPAQ